jgi:hypothetical protein
VGVNPFLERGDDTRIGMMRNFKLHNCPSGASQRISPAIQIGTSALNQEAATRQPPQGDRESQWALLTGGCSRAGGSR